MNMQFVAARLAAQYGVKVRAGLRRWLEDVFGEQDVFVGIGPDGAPIIERRRVLLTQIKRDDGMVFEREDGGAILEADIAAATAAAEADQAAADAVKAARAARRTALAADTADTFIDRLRGAMPDEIRAWVQANVTDLASARQAIAKLAVAVAYTLNGGTAK